MVWSMTRPLVLVTEELSPPALAWLAERCAVERVGPEDPQFAEMLAKAEGLIVRTYTRVDGAMLDNAPKLRVVARAGTGLDNVDEAACAARGIAVRNTPDANTQAVVEFVIAAVFDALRPRVFLEKPVELPAWRSLREELIAKREVGDLTLGVLGLGRIGSRVAKAAAGLGVRTIYHDVVEIAASQRFDAAPVSRDELLATSDILSVHVDGRAENAQLLKAEAFARMKPVVVVINTSRGFVMDNYALADFMIANPAALAILDVHDPEPFGADYPLLDIANVHLTPHIASATAAAKERMSWVVREVWEVLGG